MQVPNSIGLVEQCDLGIRNGVDDSHCTVDSQRKIMECFEGA